MKTSKQTLGQWGENLATEWLQGKGYIIIEQNYTSPPGEIDIVARNRDTISFIEVKTRGGHPGSAERSVGFVKQEHLTKAAKYYCRQWNINLLQTSIQFEQISVYYDKVSKKAKITKYLLPVGVKSRYYR